MMGIAQGVLIKFKEVANSFGEFRPFEYLDINFCYMDLEFKNRNHFKDEIIKVILKRGNFYIHLLDNISKELKIWIKILNKYLIRIDKPNSYILLDKLGSGANATVYKVEK